MVGTRKRPLVSIPLDISDCVIPTELTGEFERIRTIESRQRGEDGTKSATFRAMHIG
jgi:hypothetical protein